MAAVGISLAFTRPYWPMSIARCGAYLSQASFC
jgi:hypothetical protein